MTKTPPEANPNPHENSETHRVSAEVLNYLNIREEPSKSGAIFILGGSSLAPVERATELYRAGFSQKISFISTGGKFGGDKVWGMLEDQKYRQVLEEGGVPSDAIVSEGMTTNTLAEAYAAIPFMEKEGVDTSKVILVSRPMHQRRAYLTFKKQHPGTQYINCPANEAVDLDDPEVQIRLVQEAERLFDYSSKGDVEKEVIPKEVIEAVVILRRELKASGVYTPRVKPQKN